jgi:hypothetical protein
MRGLWQSVRALFGSGKTPATSPPLNPAGAEAILEVPAMN